MQVIIYLGVCGSMSKRKCKCKCKCKCSASWFNGSDGVGVAKVIVVYLEFPEEFADIQSYQKGNKIYINSSFSGSFPVPQYMPQVLL